MKKTIDLLASLMIIMVSGAVMKLIQEGGAHDQFVTIKKESGLISTIPLIWKLSVVIFILTVFAKYGYKYFKLDVYFSLLFVYFFSASLWSDYPRAGFFCAFNIFISYLLINAHVNLCGWQNAIKFLSKVFMAILLASLFTILAIPSYGIAVGDHAGSWQGVFTHKNTLGAFVTLTFIFYIWLFKNSQNTTNALLGIALSLLLAIGSQSSTSAGIILICGAFSSIFYIPYIKNIVFYLRYFIIFIIFLFGIYIVLSAVNGDVYSVQDKDSSFSGRNKIWSYFLDEIESEPLLGHGLDQIGSAIVEDDTYFLMKVGIEVQSTHNGFLDCLYSVGYIGSFLLLIVLLNSLRYKHYTPAFEISLFILIYLIIENTFESKLIGFDMPLIMFMYFYAITKSMLKQNYPSHQGTSKNH